MKDVILHAFNWKFKDIADMAQRIADAGYGAVLFPPPLYSDENGPEWWQRYQPKDYRIVRSHLGRKADVQRAIDELAKWGVKSYVDVVFNHMANEWREDRWHFPGKAELERYKKERAEFEKDKLFGNLVRFPRQTMLKAFPPAGAARSGQPGRLRQRPRRGTSS
ncbi:MAG: hypothetical protein IPN71_07360 [Fibrobacteres bacterium]|nr:hypothetical protein [Fibrobacterota bacterium]